MTSHLLYDQIMKRFLPDKLPNRMKYINELCSDEFEKPSRCSFSALPNEIIIRILRNLDLKSLCYVSRVNKRFNNLVKNCTLFTSLNLEPYSDIINARALYDLAPRCKYLQRLDLSLCNRFYLTDFVYFIDTCGDHLTHLRLNCCSYIGNYAIIKISERCKNLKELGLRCCYLIRDEGFEYLENLEFLECLDLLETRITTQILCKILRRNPRMLHLNIGNTYRDDLNVDEVARELRNSCPDLKSINLWMAQLLTSQGFAALAQYKRKLKIIDIWLAERARYTFT